MTDVVGIDIGGTHIRTVMGNNKGELRNRLTERTDSKRIMEQIYGMIDNYSGYGGIGIGSVGPLDSIKGIITNPPNIKIRNLRIAELLEKRYNVKCSLLNDCVAGVYGEKVFGAGKRAGTLVYVTFSTGVGAGVIEGNKLLMGKDGNAHEVGHLSVDAEMRLKCGCGSTGRHWEAYCAGINIPTFARHMLATKYEGKRSVLNTSGVESALDLFSAASTDEVASQIIEDLGRINASGIANIINAYDPDLVTMGGSMMLNNEGIMLGPIKKHIKDYVINALPKMMVTPLKEDVILAGAVAKALDLKF